MHAHATGGSCVIFLTGRYCEARGEVRPGHASATGRCNSGEAIYHLADSLLRPRSTKVGRHSG